MTSIGGSLNIQFDGSSSLGQNGTNILPSNASTVLSSAITKHAKHFHGGSKFSKAISSLQQTDPNFVKTLQTNVQTAVSQAKAQGQSGAALAAVAQNAVVSTFQNASASDQTAINNAFGTSIFSNGTFNASALQSVFSSGSTQTGATSSGSNVSTQNLATIGLSSSGSQVPLTLANTLDSDGDSDSTGINLSA